MRYEIREARESDLPYLAENLRAADIREFIATYGHTRVINGLSASLRSSQEALVGINDNGDPTVIWGIRSITPTCSLIWACATRDVERYRVPFLRNCRKVLKDWFDRSPDTQYLMNFTHGSNTLHHRWLEWCGADVLPEVPFGKHGESFRPFVIWRHKCVT